MIPPRRASAEGVAFHDPLAIRTLLSDVSIGAPREHQVPYAANIPVSNRNAAITERLAIAQRIVERMQGRAGNPNLISNSGNISLIEKGQTRDLAAAKAGLGSGKTLEAAQKVVDHGVPGFPDLKSEKSRPGAHVSNVTLTDWARSRNDTLSRPLWSVLAAAPSMLVSACSMLVAASSLPLSVLLNQMVMLTSNQTSNLPLFRRVSGRSFFMRESCCINGMCWLMYRLLHLWACGRACEGGATNWCAQMCAHLALEKF